MNQQSDRGKSSPTVVPLESSSNDEIKNKPSKRRRSSLLLMRDAIMESVRDVPLQKLRTVSESEENLDVPLKSRRIILENGGSNILLAAKLLIGIVFIYGDLVTDILVSISFYNRGQTDFFIGTMAFLVFPLLMQGMMTRFMYDQGWADVLFALIF